ncbi:hypothetical protein NIES2104_15620 [Leptolyngbya sp. NIES-2104]|nr:hypothetical protein NIES2104_15620 [Leptolyngbya sp. NIES-2104]
MQQNENSISQDETEYLLSTKANRDHLMSAIQDVATKTNLVSFTPEKWNEASNSLLSDWQVKQAQRLIKSFHHWTGKTLIETPEALFNAPFVVVSHGTEPDPIFNYGNQQALTLWEMDWETFTRTPSRQSAEPVSQEERLRLLTETKSKGYVSGYRGIRISSTGKRFWIEDVILWTVLDELNQPCGQAATFSSWTFI